MTQRDRDEKAAGGSTPTSFSPGDFFPPAARPALPSTLIHAASRAAILTRSHHIYKTQPKSTQETKAVFEKLHKYMGKSIRALVERPDEEHVLRLHRNRVFYVRADLMRKATTVSVG